MFAFYTPFNEILGIVNFNHYHGCQNCSLKGSYMRSKMSFHKLPDNYATREQYLRTDDSFRNKLSPEHHKQFSILEELPIDMIENFVIADQLHLFHFGIMKKLEN